MSPRSELTDGPQIYDDELFSKRGSPPTRNARPAVPRGITCSSGGVGILDTAVNGGPVPKRKSPLCRFHAGFDGQQIVDANDRD